MKNIFIVIAITVLTGCCATVASAAVQDLLENGGFDHPDHGLEGWIVDYAWSGNKHYAENADKVLLVPQKGSRGNAVKLLGDNGAGVKMESLPIPFDMDYSYECTLDIRGGPYRVYLAGYKWKPGIRPHDDPELGELRMVYKSKAASGSASSWKEETTRLPGVKPTSMALQHLKQVRFVTVYIYFLQPGFVDNVSLTRTENPSAEP